MLAVVAVRVGYLFASLGSDEAGYLLVARHWHLHGPDLYGRYFVDRPPLLMGIFRLASLVPWDHFIRLLAVPATLVFVGAAAGAAREVAGDRGARAAALGAAALTVTPVLGADEANGEIFAVPFVMLSVWALLAAVRRRGTGQTALALAAGVAAGLAVMVKQSFGDGAVFGATLLCVSAVQGRLPLRLAVRTALAMLAGGCAVLLAGIAYVAVSGVGPGVVLYALAGFRGAALTVLTGHHDPALAARRFTIVGFALASGALPLAVLLGREALRRRRNGWSPAAWAVLVTVLAETAAVVASGSYWPHYLIQLAPMLALAVGMGVHRVRALRAGAVVTVASALVVSLAVDVARASGADPTGVPTGRWVAEAGHPRDTAMVLYGHAEVQESSGMQSPYPYLWTLPLRTLDPHLALLRTTLAGRSAPTWVVVWDRLDAWGIDAQGRTRRTLADHYHRVGAVCGHQVWLHDGVRRQLPPLPAC